MAEDYFATRLTNPHLGPMQLCWERRPLGLNNLRYEVVRRAKPQKIHPTPVYSHRDDLPQTRFRVLLRTPLTTLHDRPGDISLESWGRLQPMGPEGDVNANVRDADKKDLSAEYNRYLKAQEAQEAQKLIEYDYTRQARDYKIKIGEVKTGSAEKRAAKEATTSTSPDHGVQQDHTYTKPENRPGPDMGPDVTPDTNEITEMDLAGPTDGSFSQFFMNGDKVARAAGANKMGTPKHLA
jgi:hypothetical protein